MNEAELATILSRLETLENKFQETVEAEKLEAMAEFAAGAGHEINNPLTIIAGRAQLFLQGETDPERRRSLALVNSQAMRIYEMIADMMLFARPPQPNFAPVDAAKII
ncbi:MAG: histidine kinase dimerization/phospho-acceptor domain-containing protein, partial [Thermoguttaceae bacterium]